jgi:hypothetical protein
MTISTQDYADLSDRVYKPPVEIDPKNIIHPNYKPEIINGIKYQPLEYLDGTKKHPPTGYQGTIYQRMDTGEIIVAHRGTEPKIKDVGADATMVFQRVNPQLKDAEALTQRALELAKEYAEKHPGIPVPQVTTTGHSLGGSLAQITAHKFHLHAETFNPYGTVSLQYGLHPGQDDIVNHVMAADVVSAASPQPGQVRVYASEKEVQTARALGYANDHSPSLLQKLVDASNPIHAQIVRPLETAALNLGSHSISNFTNTDDQGHPHPSILADPQARQRATQNAVMFDKYRHDVQTIRGALSASGDVVQATSQGIDAARHGIAQAVTHGAQAAQREAAQFGNAAQQASDQLSKTALDATLGISNKLNQTLGHEGVAQPDTAPAARTPADHGHPAHALYESVRKHVAGAYAAEKGVPLPPEQLDNLAAAVTANARKSRMTEVASVIVSTNRMQPDVLQVFAYQGRPGEPGKPFSMTPVDKAINTPVEQSWQRFDQITAQNQAADLERQQAQQMRQQRGHSI